MNIWNIILLVLAIVQSLHVGLIVFLDFPMGNIIFAGVVMVFIWWLFISSCMWGKR